MSAVRIAHVTDVHVARPLTFAESNPKRILGYVNYHLFRRRRYTEEAARAALVGMLEGPGGLSSSASSPSLPDCVLLTGDITQHGLDAEFAAARELFAPVAARGIPILAVPGNHDVYGRGMSPALCALIKDWAAPLVPGDGGIYRCAGAEILPLFQCVPTPPFCSYGRQDPEELARAHGVWAKPPEGVVRIVTGHFPVIDPHGGKLLRYRGLRRAEALIRFCAEHSVAAYFCGHDHKAFVEAMPGGCVQYAGAALSAVKGAEKRVGMHEF